MPLEDVLAQMEAKCREIDESRAAIGQAIAKVRAAETVDAGWIMQALEMIGPSQAYASSTALYLGAAVNGPPYEPPPEKAPRSNREDITIMHTLESPPADVLDAVIALVRDRSDMWWASAHDDKGNEITVFRGSHP